MVENESFNGHLVGNIVGDIGVEEAMLAIVEKKKIQELVCITVITREFGLSQMFVSLWSVHTNKIILPILLFYIGVLYAGESNPVTDSLGQIFKTYSALWTLHRIDASQLNLLQNL